MSLFSTSEFHRPVNISQKSGQSVNWTANMVNGEGLISQRTEKVKTERDFNMYLVSKVELVMWRTGKIHKVRPLKTFGAHSNTYLSQDFSKKLSKRYSKSFKEASAVFGNIFQFTHYGCVKSLNVCLPCICWRQFAPLGIVLDICISLLDA